MSNSIFNNNKTKKIIIYIFMFLTILNCASIYYSHIINNLWKIFLFIIFVRSASKIPKNLLDKFIIFIFLFSVYVMIFLIFNYLQSPTFNLFNYLLLLLVYPIMLITFFLSQFVNNKGNKVLYIFENIMLFLSVISLIFWILSIIGLPPNMSFVTHWGGTAQIPGYFGIDFLSQRNTTFLGISNVVRNSGIFAEPPMYSYTLCIALLIELFLKRHSSIINFKVVLLFIVILSTTSTTGLLISIPAIMLRIYLSSRNKIKRLIILICIPIVLYILHLILQYKINDVSSQTYSSSSYIQRHDDIISCFHAWLAHPILGNGINNPNVGNKYSIVNILPYMNSNDISAIKDSIGGTTGFMRVLAYGGLFDAMLYVIPSILVSFKSWSIAIFSILSFVLLIFTSINESFLCIMILSYFWAYILDNYTNSNNLLVGGE